MATAKVRPVSIGASWALPEWCRNVYYPCRPEDPSRLRAVLRHDQKVSAFILFSFAFTRFNALTPKRQGELKCMLFLVAAMVWFGLEIAYLDDPYKNYVETTFPVAHPALSRVLVLLPAIPAFMLVFFGFRAVWRDVQKQQASHELASQISWEKFSHGETPMRTAFWRWHFPTCLISAFFVVFIMADDLRQGTLQSYFFFGIYLLVGIASQIFTLRGVWLSSRNHAGPRCWRMLTRTSAMLLTAAVVALLVVYGYVAATNQRRPGASSSAPTLQTSASCETSAPAHSAV